MTVQNISSRTVGVAGALAVAFLALASIGVWYILEQGWGLVFEVAYLLALLIALAVVADRLFVR